MVVTEPRLARASTSQDERFASLFLLVSKADVGGHCVERKLRCSYRGSDWDSTCPVHTLRSQIEEVARAAGSPRRRRPALVPDGRQLGAVKERDGGRMAAVGASWRYRGRPLGAEIGSETVRPRRMAHHCDPALGSMGEHAGSGVRGGGLRGGAEDGTR